MPPECFQEEGGDALSPVADIFSVGVMLHMLLLGRGLFSGEDLNELIKNNSEMRFDLSGAEYQKIDRYALELMQKMLEIDPRKRWTALECLNHSFFREWSE